MTSAPELRDAVRELADQLAAGEVPAAIPKIGGASFDPEEVATAILDGLGDTRRRGRAGDGARCRARRRRARRRSSTRPPSPSPTTPRPSPTGSRPSRRVDLTAVVAARAEQPVTSVVARFDDARDPGPLDRAVDGRRRGAARRPLATVGLLAPGRSAPGAGLVDRRRPRASPPRSSSAGWLVGRAAVASPLHGGRLGRPRRLGAAARDRRARGRRRRHGRRRGGALSSGGAPRCSCSAGWRSSPGARRRAPCVDAGPMRRLVAAGVGAVALVAFGADRRHPPRDGAGVQRARRAVRPALRRRDVRRRPTTRCRRRTSCRCGPSTTAA